MINFIEDAFKTLIKRIIGLIFISIGFTMAILNWYNPILVLLLSIFCFAFWWKD